MITAIGLIAALLTTISFIPQLFKIVRTRSAEGISVTMYGTFTAGILTWIVYGMLQHDLVVVAANVVTPLLAIPILVIASIENRTATRR